MLRLSQTDDKIDKKLSSQYTHQERREDDVKRSFKTSTRVSVLIGALGLMALPFSLAEAALYWPPVDGGGSGGDGGDGGEGTDPSNDYNQGFADGEAAQKEACQIDPSSCGLSLQAFLDNTGFGETEPNDQAFSADGLVLEEVYHANSFDYFDEDWYYVTTTGNNQNITISFQGVQTAFAVNPEGWLISVRDSAGNILATFDSASPGQGTGEDTTQGREITVTVGNPGTYYITVQPWENPLDQGTGFPGGLYKAYNIAAMVSDPGQTSPNPDSNFMDAELEPNDTRAQATPLGSTTNMFAYFDKSAVGGSAIGAFNFDSDWFVYSSGGNEILNLRMCSRESCGRSEQSEVLTDEFARIWHLTVSNASGQVLLEGPIQPGQSINAALTFAGDYYVHFGPEATGEVVCATGDAIADCPANQIVNVVYDASGAYNFTVIGTDLSPTAP